MPQSTEVSSKSEWNSDYSSLAVGSKFRESFDARVVHRPPPAKVPQATPTITPTISAGWAENRRVCRSNPSKNKQDTCFAFASGAKGRWFESTRAYQTILKSMICRSSIFAALALTVCFGSKGSIFESAVFHEVLLNFRLVLPVQLPLQYRLTRQAAVPTFQRAARSEHSDVESLHRRFPFPRIGRPLSLRRRSLRDPGHAARQSPIGKYDFALHRTRR